MELKAAVIILFISNILIATCKEGKKSDAAESDLESGPCKAVADKVRKSGLIGAYIPTCEADGYYAALQCHGSTGVCWCSDKLGQPLAEDDRKSTDCANPCFKKILDNPPPTILVHGVPKAIKLDIPAPRCDLHGYYTPKQCNKTHCWCVDKMGSLITKTRKQAEEITCPKED